MRRIIVGIKRVVDATVRIRVKSDATSVALDGIKTVLNPFDEIALEEALRLREHGSADEVIVASVAPPEVQPQLRSALAMGANRAILIVTDQPDAELEPMTIARALLALAQRLQPMLVLLGKQAIDYDSSQVGPMLAALWNRPQATFASKIDLRNNVATVTREVDAGLEKLEIDLPAVVTADLRLNEPRYVKLPDIMQAKKKPLETLAIDQLTNRTIARVRPLRYEPPPERQKGIRVATPRSFFPN